MKIAIDLRSLQNGQFTGVENYTLNLLEHLLPMDKQNSYTLFYNAFKEAQLPDLNFVNSKLVKKRWSNKILNLALKFKLVSMEKLAGDFDCLFMPNLNQFNISPKAKLAITVHDLSPVVTPEFYDAKRRLWHKFLNYQKAFNRANVIFAVSEYTKTDLVRLFKVDEKKIKVVYPGIDNKVFQMNIEENKLREIRNQYSLPGDFILFLNTIEPRKNLSNLIRAFEKMDHPAHLVIAGRKGWKDKAIFEEIKHSKKSLKIKYLGYIKDEDKPAVIKLSKALVYPSFYEGFGFQPLEAMAMGTPTIVSQVTALPEVVGDASLLINPYNVSDITATLNLLLKNEQLKSGLVAKGLERVKKFSWEKSSLSILEALNSL